MDNVMARAWPTVKKIMTMSVKGDIEELAHCGRILVLLIKRNKSL